MTSRRRKDAVVARRSDDPARPAFASASASVSMADVGASENTGAATASTVGGPPSLSAGGGEKVDDADPDVVDLEGEEVASVAVAHRSHPPGSKTADRRRRLGLRVPTASTNKSRGQSKAKGERRPSKKRMLSPDSRPPRSKSRRSGSNGDRMPPPDRKSDGDSDGDSGDHMDSSSQSESEREDEDASSPRKARTNPPRKRASSGGGGRPSGDGSERTSSDRSDSSTGSSTSTSGSSDTDDGSDFKPEEEEGDDSSSEVDQTSEGGTPRSPPTPAARRQRSTGPTEMKKKRRSSPAAGNSSSEKNIVKKQRNKPIMRGKNGGVPQPHLSVAYRNLDDARRRRSTADANLLDARRKLEAARSAVHLAEIEIAEADAAVSRRGGEVVDAELRVRPSRWNEMYRRLAAYRMRHGHCLLSRRIPGATLSSEATGRGKVGGEDGEGENGDGDDDPDLDELAKWVFNQRRYLKSKRGEAADVFGSFGENPEVTAAAGGVAGDGETTKNEAAGGGGGTRWCKAYRIAALDRLGFVWEEEVEVKWTMNLRRLAQYGAEHGHCHVPQRYKPDMALGRWVNSQRVHYRLWREGKPTQMTDERYRRLREVGFVFRCDNAPRHRVQHRRRRHTAEEEWEERFAEFAEFRAEHGHGHLNQEIGPKAHVELCRWATFQRKQYKLYREGRPSLLTGEKVERLDSLGFYWSIKEARADLPHMGGKKKSGAEEDLPARSAGETDITTAGDRARSGSNAMPDEAPDAGDHSSVMKEVGGTASVAGDEVGVPTTEK